MTHEFTSHTLVGQRFGSKTRQELQQLIHTQQDAQIAERFQSRLEFGTAGLRGKVGCGPNRMNRLVIQETAAGLGIT